MRRLIVASCLSWFALCCSPAVADDALRAEAVAAMRRAATYYRESVAVHGGYVYHYSLDLQQRLGEGVASPEQIWVQPPGPPTVGMAYLAAWRATGDQYYLDAALEAADALVYGQLQSGGWTNAVDFDPRGERVSLYRNGRGRGRNYSTLDDGITQAALEFLIQADEACEFQNEAIHTAARVALDALLAAQFPNGAFPQVWPGADMNQSVVPAAYPDYDWRTENRIKEYWHLYTLNDGLAGTVSDTLLAAIRVYHDDRCEAALRRLGDFLILAQMPDPQPAWAQQYDYQMRPVWARKFEPPAVTGRESQDAIATLLKIHRHTGDAKYLEPIPRAAAYLHASLLADGQLARYYELQSNRPLYMTTDYQLTYDDSRVPNHYGWKTESFLDDLEAELASQQLSASTATTTAPVIPSDEEVRAILAALDDSSRWVSDFQGERLVGQPKYRPGDRYLASAVFSANLETLSRYVNESK